MSLDVDALTSESDVGVNSAVAQGGHEGGGTVVHPGKESLAYLHQLFLVYNYGFLKPLS